MTHEPLRESNGDHVHAEMDDETRSHVPVHYSPRTGRNIVIFSVIVMLGLVAAFAVVDVLQHRGEAAEEQAVRDAAKAPISLDVIHAQLSGAEKAIELPGNAQSFYQTTIFARTSGYLK